MFTKPEDHPEQHPWRFIAVDARPVYPTVEVKWCPACGAILRDGHVTLPEIAKEIEYHKPVEQREGG